MTTYIDGIWINALGKTITSPEHLFISIDAPLHYRNSVLIASTHKIWQKFQSHSWPIEDDLVIYPQQAKRLFNKIRGKHSGTTLIEDLGFPDALNIEEASEQFSFPPGHPIDGMAYGCTSLEPNLYIPLSSFHDYIFQSKMSSFVEMCSCLNAKVAKVSYVEENGKEITSKLEVQNIPVQGAVADGEINSTTQSKVLNGLRIDYTFPTPNHNLIEFNSPWLIEEPSWQTLNHVRFNRDVQTFQVELNHNNDFGVESNLVAMFNKVGAKIGGTYSEFKKRRLVYDVEFWPKRK